MSITLTEQELEDLLSYKDQYERLKEEVDQGGEQWTLAALDDKLTPRVHRAEWIAIAQLTYILNYNADAELAGIADIGKHPPTRVRASVEDVDVTNRVLRCLFGDVDLIIEVHEPPPRADPYHTGLPEVFRVDTYRPVRGLRVVVEVIEYGKVNPIDLVRIEFLASLSVMSTHTALQAGLDSRFNHISELTAPQPAPILPPLHHSRQRSIRAPTVDTTGSPWVVPMVDHNPRRSIRAPSTTSQRIGNWILST